MSTVIKYLTIFLIFGFLTVGCNKVDKIDKVVCELDLAIKPFCNFNPKFAQDVVFPVQVLRDGNNINFKDYNIIWDIDPDFGGSAISVTYSDLPLKVNVTEISTECVGEAIIDKDYWD